MKKIIEDNYNSIVKRGLITPQTKKVDFVSKLIEEVNEFIYDFNTDSSTKGEELSDVILVCLNIAKHYNIDIEKELNKKIKKNYERASI